ncbi:MAG: M28 family peptidase, partial [Candidatus Heimdallarchaeota archaeon]|nr:M28 family peptidase [Candidatus Heimdallarchaeota archaeon]
MNRKSLLLGFMICILLIPFSLYRTETTDKGTIEISLSSNSTFFNATSAYETIAEQVQLGPRIPGSYGIEKTRLLLEQSYNTNGDWLIDYQNFTKLWINDENITLVNIIYTPVTLNNSLPYFLLLAHYDTRLWADRDPNHDLHRDPVPGANDGASGVAITLELGKILVTKYNISNFKIILFDGEDQGNQGIPGWNWLEGSRFFVESDSCELEKVSYAILLDMVGGKDAIFKREGYSDQYAQTLVSQIWNMANNLGYEHFFQNISWTKIIDDHLPFLEKGVPAVDIIDDFSTNYKAWHTTSDNLSQISTETLNA